MASNIFHRFFRRKKRPDEDSTESHQRQESPGAFSSQSRIMEIQRAEREALIHQIERLYASEKAHTEAVLERLGLLVQQDPLPSPQPPAGPRQRPESSVPGRRIRPFSGVPPMNVEVVSNSWNSRTRRHQRSPETQEEKAEEVHLRRDRSSGPSASISSEDTHPPRQPRPHPVEVSPPAAPQPRRRVSRLPVMLVNLSGADKEVGGYRLQTAKYQVEATREGLKHFNQNSTVHLPRPPAAPRRNPAVPPIAPAPPPKPAPPKKRGTHRGTSLHPATTVSGSKKTENTCKLQTADNKNHDKLQPLSDPVESLSRCFKLFSSDDWMKKVEGLQIARALAQHHPDTLRLKLYDVCVAVIAEVKNLRSSVACAAMDTIVYLCVYLQRAMDSQAERTGRALLLKIAQSAASSFIQQQANMALEALMQNCSPGRALNALLNTGLSHLSVAVRASTAQQLRLLADRLGAAAILTAGKSFTQRFLTAVSKMSLDAAAEVRHHGQAILQGLALHRGFTKLWRKLIDERDRRPLEKIVKNVTRD